MEATKTTTREEWLKERRKGIGGSDVGAVLGLNQWRSPLDVFNDKTGREKKDVSNKEAVHFGTILEDTVAKEFAERTGMKIQRVTQSLSKGENGWMRANIDRAIINPEIAKRVSVNSEEKYQESGLMLSTDVGLECKTANAFTAKNWGASQEAEIVAGEVVSEHEIPITYELQCQWYMSVTGACVWYLAVLIGGQDFRMYEIKRNDALINTIVQRCKDFWFNHVVADVPPAPVTSEDMAKVYPTSNGDMAEADEAAVVAIGELRNIDAQIKELKKSREEHEEVLKRSIAQRDGLTIGGKKAATWKSSVRHTVDTKTLKSEYPDIYEDCLKESTSRTLRIY